MSKVLREAWKHIPPHIVDSLMSMWNRMDTTNRWPVVSVLRQLDIDCEKVLAVSEHVHVVEIKPGEIVISRDEFRAAWVGLQFHLKELSLQMFSMNSSAMWSELIQALRKFNSELIMILRGGE